MLTLFGSPLWSTTYYVSPTGNDSNDGLGIGDGNAWLTIGKANTVLTAGDTVEILAGTYTTISNQINPDNFGTSGNPITFINYDSGVVNLTVAANVNIRGNSYITIDGLNFSNQSGSWVSMREASTMEYNIIQNCTFDEVAVNWAGIDMGESGATCRYNKILNNTFNGVCNPDDLIYFRGGCTYNLIQGNTFAYYAAHVSMESQSSTNNYNIFKDNIIYNYYHTGINLYTNSHYALIEGNTIYDCGKDHADNACGTQSDRDLAFQYHPGLQLGSSYLIIRRNEFHGNGNAIGHQSKDDNTVLTQHCRMYHNVFHDNYYGFYANTVGSVTDNIYKNNVFYDNTRHVRHAITHATRDNYFFYNNFSGTGDFEYYPDGTPTLGWLETNRSTYWANNTVDSPLFTDAANHDYSLQAGSALIDAGDWLTTITSANGSGTSFVVDDARYFFNGWGIVNGDEIQLEGTAVTVGVTTVDYGTNTITVDESVSWTQGDGVALAFNGDAPDIGANEYEGEAPAATPQILRIRDVLRARQTVRIK